MSSSLNSSTDSNVVLLQQVFIESSPEAFHLAVGLVTCGQ